MSLPEATLNCPICDSLEHTLFPILNGKYSSSYVCSSCNQTLWKNRRDPNFEIQKYRWNKKLQDYILID